MRNPDGVSSSAPIGSRAVVVIEAVRDFHRRGTALEESDQPGLSFVEIDDGAEVCEYSLTPELAPT